MVCCAGVSGLKRRRIARFLTYSLARLTFNLPIHRYCTVEAIWYFNLFKEKKCMFFSILPNMLRPVRHMMAVVLNEMTLTNVLFICWTWGLVNPWCSPSHSSLYSTRQTVTYYRDYTDWELLANIFTQTQLRPTLVHQANQWAGLVAGGAISLQHLLGSFNKT